MFGVFSSFFLFWSSSKETYYKFSSASDSQSLFICYSFGLRMQIFSVHFDAHLRMGEFFSLLQIYCMILLFRRSFLYRRCVFGSVFLHTCIPRITRRKKHLCVCDCIVATHMFVSRWTKQSHKKYSRLQGSSTTTNPNTRTHTSPFAIRYNTRI